MRLQAYVGSVFVGGTALMCRGRECARLGSATRRVSFYASLGGGGLRPSGTSSGSTGISVRKYISAMRTLLHRIYMGAYAHKYVGHETANWWGWGGLRSAHCSGCG
jgi:hypothetical protein